MNNCSTIFIEPLVREKDSWVRPTPELALPRAARTVYSGFVLHFLLYGLLESVRLRIDGAHYHQGNDADYKPTGGEKKTPTYVLKGMLSTRGVKIADCKSCRKREKLKEGQDMLRINAIDDEHDFLTMTNSSVRIKIKPTCSSCHQRVKNEKNAAFLLSLWIVDEQDGSVVAQGEYDLGEVIANADPKRRRQKTAAAQGEPPKKRRRTKAAGSHPPSPGLTASAPTSPVSAASSRPLRNILPAPGHWAFQPLPGAPWPLGPANVVQGDAIQAHADPIQSPFPPGGTSSLAPSPTPSPMSSPVDFCADVSRVSNGLEEDFDNLLKELNQFLDTEY